MERKIVILLLCLLCFAAYPVMAHAATRTVLADDKDRTIYLLGVEAIPAMPGSKPKAGPGSMFLQFRLESIFKNRKAPAPDREATSGVLHLVPTEEGHSIFMLPGGSISYTGGRAVLYTDPVHKWAEAGTTMQDGLPQKIWQQYKASNTLSANGI